MLYACLEIYGPRMAAVNNTRLSTFVGGTVHIEMAVFRARISRQDKHERQ